MPVQRIDSIYDIQNIQKEQRVLIDSLTDAQKKVVELYNIIQQYKSSDFVQASADAKKMSDALKDTAKATEQATKANIAFERSQQAINKARIDNAKAAAAEAKEEKAVVQLIVAEDKAQQQLNKSKQQGIKDSAALEKQKATELKQLDELENDYLQLSKAYNEAALKAKNYALRLGETHPTTVAAIKDAKDMYDVLYRLDRQVGQSQRNVGNYKSAWDGLGVSTTQLARELPALAISGQTFMLAISNNLPVFIDEVQKAKAEIAALRAQGQEVPGIASRIASSLFSFTGVMTIAITILTVFGKQIGDFVTGLFKGKGAIEEVTESQILFNEAVLEGVERIRSFGQLARQSFNSELVLMKQRLDLLNATGASAEEIFNAEQDYNSKRKSYVVQQLTGIKNVNTLTDEQLFKIRALQSGSLVALGKLTKDLNNVSVQIATSENETNKERLENSKKLLQIQYNAEKGNFDLRNKLLEDYFASEVKITENETELDKKRAASRFEINKLILEDSIRTYQEIAKNNKNLPVIREDAARNVFELQKELIDLTREYELSQAKLTATDIEKINTEAMIERKNALIEFNDLSYEILKDRRKIELENLEAEKQFFKEGEEAAKRDAALQKQLNDGIKQGQKDLINTELDLLRKAEADKLLILQTSTDQRITALNEQRKQGLISESKYATELAKIQKDAAKEALKVQIESSKQQLQLLTASGLAGTDAWLKLRAAIAGAEKALSSMGGTSVDSLTKIRSILQGVQQAVETTTEAINTIFDISYERQRAQLESQRTEIEKNHEREISNIQESTLSEEEKQRRMQIAQATTDAKLQEIERRQREAEYRRARFQKMADIAAIITRTALAVVTALTEGDPYTKIARSIAAGALGAAQLAAALAAPLPSFHTGTESSPEGWALTDEKGPEGYVEPGGKAYIGNDKPTVRYLKKGTKIIPHDELNKYMFNKMLIETAALLTAPARQQGSDYANDDKNANKIIKAIKGKKSVLNITVDNGRSQYLLRNVYE